MQISITDLLLYFAKYPRREGVLELFNRNVLPGDMGTAYTGLKTYIENMEGEALLPALEYLVFGNDETEVDRIIQLTNGFFLMVEYGPVRGNAPDRTGRRDADWKLSLIVAYHFNADTYDAVTESIVMDQCMDYLLQIAVQMEEDEYPTCPLRRFSESALHFTPINPADLYQSIGWMMDFSETIQAVV